jgi:hypothetical protein
MTLSRLLLVLALAPLATTAHAQRAAAPKSCLTVDTTLASFIWPHPDSSPPPQDLDALERRLKNAPESSLPAVLFALGRLKARFVVDSAYGAAHPEEFFYQELASSWMYNGWHFTELQRRFPQSAFTDDAAYEMTLIPMGGECEGYVPCQVSSLFMKLEPFLRAHPASPLAPLAVQRTLLAFSAITPRMDLVRGSEAVDVPEIRKLVASLESLARALDPSLGFTLLTRVAELREQLGDLPAARSTYRYMVDRGAADNCLSAHVRRLEARLARP